jgi:hypothetical protein
MRPAKIAFEKPDTGVTINKKGAFYLIKDSADITVKYLVHLCYGSYSNPIKDLKGKFTQSEIIDFVGRSKEQQYTRQLLNIILTDIGCVNQSFSTDTNNNASIDFSISEEEDVYGDYELEESESNEKDSVEEVQSIDVNDASGIIQKLIEVFQAK